MISSRTPLHTALVQRTDQGRALAAVQTTNGFGTLHIGRSVVRAWACTHHSVGDSVIQLGTESDETCELGPGRRVFPAETGATRLKSFQLNEKSPTERQGIPLLTRPRHPRELPHIRSGMIFRADTSVFPLIPLVLRMEAIRMKEAARSDGRDDATVARADGRRRG